MKAVASVVMNRVNIPIGEYSRISQGGSIRNIIFQPNQFDYVKDQLFDQYNPQNIYNMNPTEIHYPIADWALSGNKLNEIGEYLWYLNAFRLACSNTFSRNGSGTFHTRLGNHCFYTLAFLIENIGKLMRVKFLIGTNTLTDKIRILEAVGTSYILLRSLQSNEITYADIYSIKFITISDYPTTRYSYY